MMVMKMVPKLTVDETKIEEEREVKWWEFEWRRPGGQWMQAFSALRPNEGINIHGNEVRNVKPGYADPPPEPSIEPPAETEPLVVDAEALTTERSKDYGHPLDNFTRMAKLKDVLAEMPDPVLRQAAEMVAVKLARLINNPYHIDSWRDIGGFAHTALMVIDERKRRGM
jgi:Domain of unknown function (DUF6378)